jgi:hypothetical protein
MPVSLRDEGAALAKRLPGGFAQTFAAALDPADRP